MSAVPIPVNEHHHRQAEEVATQLGMEITTAVQIFLQQMVNDRKFPFTPTIASSQHLQQKSGNTAREEWLRNAVHTGLTALERNDFAPDAKVRETFKKAGVDVY